MPDEKPVLPPKTLDAPLSKSATAKPTSPPVSKPPPTSPPPPSSPPPSSPPPNLATIKEAPHIKPPAKKTNLKLIGALLAAILIATSLPVALYLVKQRQEITKQAVGECQEGQFDDRCEGECVTQGRKTRIKVTYRCVNGEWQNTGMSNCDLMYCGDDGPAEEGPTPRPTRPDEPCQCDSVGPQHANCPANSPNCDGCYCVGGDCTTEDDCAQWEDCVDGSCRSKAGCEKDSDCLSGKCQGGTCVGPGTLECHADKNGVRIINNTDQSVSGTVHWFSTWCDHRVYGCECSGSETSESLTLAAGQSWSRGILGNGPPENCAWQSDVRFALCHNAGSDCEDGCNGVTTTPTPAAIRCSALRAYNQEWDVVEDLNSLRVDDTVYFLVDGAGEISNARFRVNGGSWRSPTAQKEGKFYLEYQILSAGDYTVEAMVYSPSFGWR